MKAVGEGGDCENIHKVTSISRLYTEENIFRLQESNISKIAF